MRGGEGGFAWVPVSSLLVHVAKTTLLAVLALVLLAAAPARALEMPVAVAVRVAGDENASRIIVDFDKPVEVAPQLLEHPWRLVLDFPRIGYGFEVDTGSWSGMTSDMRWGDMSDSTSRMIFQFDRPFELAAIEGRPGPNGQTHSIVMDIRAADEATFRTALLDQVRTSSVVVQSTKSDRLGTGPTVSSRPRGTFLVVIDPGHGGIDSGAVGRSGTLEKDIVSAFSNQLREKLTAYDGVEVMLTREKDVFLPLNERVRIARQNNASLFISVHADSINDRNVRGATVYTISERASDSVAASIAESENRSDAIAGISFEDEPGEVADILIDLARRETLGFSVQFARLTVDSVRQETRMIKNPHRHAGFRVLRAPDIPSVLLELGYLSNKDDEALLLQEDWRDSVATAVAEAIARFASLSGRTVSLREEN